MSIKLSNSVDEPISVRNKQDNDFNKFNFTNINGITLNTQGVNDNQVIRNSYVDQFHQGIKRTRRGLGIDFYDKSSGLV